MDSIIITKVLMHNKGRMRQAYEINYSKRSET